MDLEQNTCRVVSMLCFNTMPKHLQNGRLKARFRSLRRTIIGRSGHFETASIQCKWRSMSMVRVR